MDAKKLWALPVAALEHRLMDGALVQTAGITLRQHYAGLAMQGILAGLPPTAEYDPGITARCAVEHADALLSALAKDHTKASIYDPIQRTDP